MYLKMFGFQEKPFHITPNPRFIFLSKIHKEAFAHLLYGIQQRVGFLCLTGEIGTGKTTVLRTLLGQLQDSDYRVALIFNPRMTDLELLQSIHREFGIPFSTEKDNLANLHDSLNTFLLRQREAGKTVVLVVDEAQNLDPAVLEQLRLLSNLETETEKLIQMVLVGQPELDQILRRNDLRQLRQRLAVRYRLSSMDAEDTARYIQHRIHIAGAVDTALFSDKALTRIYHYTGGTPRLINILCDRALLVAYGHDSRSVTAQDVSTAHKELEFRDRRMPAKWLTGAALGLLCLLAVYFGSQFVPVLIKLWPRDTAAQVTEARFPVLEEASSTETSVRSGEDASPEQSMVSSPAQPQPVEPLSATRISALRQAVATFDVEETAAQAVLSTLRLWNIPLPQSLPAINNNAELKINLNQHGFDTIDFEGSLAELVLMDTPAILELVLPNVTGKRFMALTAVDGEKIKVSPEITESGWLTKQELKQIWFGKAVLPYVNHARINLIHRPEQSGQAVYSLQKLLQKYAATDLVATGVYDRSTIEAVTRFQREHNLAPDGRVGSQTLFWLYREAGEIPASLSEHDL